MLELTVCPDPTCGVPAEVTERFSLWSTSGPVDHISTYCVRRHIFVLPAARSPASTREAR